MRLSGPNLLSTTTTCVHMVSASASHSHIVHANSLFSRFAFSSLQIPFTRCKVVRDAIQQDGYDKEGSKDGASGRRQSAERSADYYTDSQSAGILIQLTLNHSISTIWATISTSDAKFPTTVRYPSSVPSARITTTATPRTSKSSTTTSAWAILRKPAVTSNTSSL